MRDAAGAQRVAVAISRWQCLTGMFLMHLRGVNPMPRTCILSDLLERVSWRRLWLDAVIALTAFAMLPARTALSGGIDPDTRFTPLVAVVLTQPQAVRATDGAYHLAYELLLTNATGLRVEVTAVEVRDGRSHEPLLTLTASTAPTLSGQMNPIGASAEDVGDSSIASSSVSVVWLDVAVRSRAEIPRVLEHRITGLIVGAPVGASIPFEIVVARIPTSEAKPPVLGPPFGPGIWLASEGCCLNVTHHRRGLGPVNGEFSVPQRFAIDFFRLDDQFRTWIGDPAKVDSYLSYNQPILAAADGVVVNVRDGLPNQSPPQPPPIPPIDETVGNHVIVRIAPGVYVLYAHMKPGSVLVSKGQRVRRGQELGRIGTSGNSTTPHLHFQIMTTATFFPTDSTPYVFEAFTLVAKESARIWDDNVGLQPTGTIPVSPLAPTQFRNTMPLDRDIIVFPKSR
jgi:hypothetical protein